MYAINTRIHAKRVQTKTQIRKVQTDIKRRRQGLTSSVCKTDLYHYKIQRYYGTRRVKPNNVFGKPELPTIKFPSLKIISSFTIEPGSPFTEDLLNDNIADTVKQLYNGHRYIFEKETEKIFEKDTPHAEVLAWMIEKIIVRRPKGNDWECYFSKASQDSNNSEIISVCEYYHSQPRDGHGFQIARFGYIEKYDPDLYLAIRMMISLLRMRNGICFWSELIENEYMVESAMNDIEYLDTKKEIAPAMKSYYEWYNKDHKGDKAEAQYHFTCTLSEFKDQLSKLDLSRKYNRTAKEWMELSIPLIETGEHIDQFVCMNQNYYNDIQPIGVNQCYAIWWKTGKNDYVFNQIDDYFNMVLQSGGEVMPLTETWTLDTIITGNYKISGFPELLYNFFSDASEYEDRIFKQSKSYRRAILRLCAKNRIGSLRKTRGRRIH